MRSASFHTRAALVSCTAPGNDHNVHRGSPLGAATMWMFMPCCLCLSEEEGAVGRDAVAGDEGAVDDHVSPSLAA